MYTALDFAKYIVKKCIDDGHPISNLQLQKILYYIQKDFLRRGDIAFEDDMASIIIETDIKLSKLDLDEIITVYKDFLYDDLYIKNIKELHITNFDEVIVERKEFKNNHVSLNSAFFSPRC